MHASPLLYGIFEADLPLRSVTPRSASLHVGLLRCGLFEAKMLQTLAKERSTTFHMYPDSDPPGELLFMQLHDVLPSLTRHQLPPKCKDFAEYSVKMKNDEWEKLKHKKIKN